MIILIAIAAAAAGVAAGWLFAQWRRRADRSTAAALIDAARHEAEHLRRDTQLRAQEEALKSREAFDRDVRERRQELTDTERRLAQREALLDHKLEALDRRTEDALAKERAMVDRERELHRLEDELEELKRLTLQELQRVGGLPADEARRMLLARLEIESRGEASALSRQILDEARQNAEREARRILTIAIERCASTQVQATTTCLVNLPSEEMKGRIIGREGRNIRAFEAATGVNVLIDDTPQTVTLSGFDPVRREVARLTMERLVADGRINPARIEEEVAKVGEEIRQSIRQSGEEAVVQVGVRAAAPEVCELLGRLKFRHSFSQNVLDHSIEVARLAGLMAVELGLNQETARRVGLFHDIGKAVAHEVEGSHATVGAQLLRKYGEPEEIAQGVASHHHELEPVTIYGALAGAADAMSASRPGARSESMEMYLSRLEKLEALAQQFPGVEKCYALQAGREIRVVVEPARLNDEAAAELARAIRRKIEAELQYPGQIKVIVVREVRAVEFAK